MPEHVIVTGGAGFVGCHVLRHLLANTDWTVALPVTFRHSGMPARIESALDGHPEWQARVKVVPCDLSAPLDTYTRARLGWQLASYIFNLASESHVDRSIDHPRAFIENNVGVALTVLEGCRPECAPRLRLLVHLSTDEVYGPAYNDPHPEWARIVPSNPYSASKAAQEAIAISYWRTFKVPLLIVNAMNMIGEMQDAEKFVPKTIRALLRDEPVTVHVSPEGEPGSRFYLHARNLADGMLWAVENVSLGSLDAEDGEDTEVGTVYRPGVRVPERVNIVGEREVNNIEMVEMLAYIIETETGRAPESRLNPVDFHTLRPGHDLRYALDGTLMNSAGWKPPMTLEESLRATVRWSLAHPSWLA